MFSVRRLAALLPIASCVLLAAPAGAAHAFVPTGSAPLAAKTLFGLSIPLVEGETRAVTIARTKAQYGTLPVVRLYSDDIPATWTTDRSLAALGTGSSVIYTFGVQDMGATANGVDDAAIIAFLRTKPAEVKAWVGLIHEPEGHVARGEFTAEQYRAATAHVAGIIRANGSIPTTVLTGSSAFADQGNAWREFYSPEIDVLAWNAYNSAQKKPGIIYKAPSKFIDPVQRIAAETGKAFGWAELGAPCIVSDPTCAKRAPWLVQMGDAFGVSGAQFVSYWNRPSMNGAADYSLSDVASSTAWASLLLR